MRKLLDSTIHAPFFWFAGRTEKEKAVIVAISLLGSLTVVTFFIDGLLAALVTGAAFAICGALALRLMSWLEHRYDESEDEAYLDFDIEVWRRRLLRQALPVALVVLGTVYLSSTEFVEAIILIGFCIYLLVFVFLMLRDVAGPLAKALRESERGEL